MIATAAPHEHVPQLVEVVYDEAGHSLREYTCTSCHAAWFE